MDSSLININNFPKNILINSCQPLSNGNVLASHLVDSGTNKSVYSCEECKSFFNKLQLSDAGKLKSDLLGVCESVLPLVLTNRKEMVS